LIISSFSHKISFWNIAYCLTIGTFFCALIISSFSHKISFWNIAYCLTIGTFFCALIIKLFPQNNRQEYSLLPNNWRVFCGLIISSFSHKIIVRNIAYCLTIGTFFCALIISSFSHKIIVRNIAYCLTIEHFFCTFIIKLFQQ